MFGSFTRIGTCCAIVCLGGLVGCTSTGNNLSAILQSPDSPLRTQSAETGVREEPAVATRDGDSQIQDTIAIKKAEAGQQQEMVAVERPSQEVRPPLLAAGNVKLIRTTAYCHKEADSLPYGTLTAAGTQLQFGGSVRSAAADWSVYPVGTRFRIVGLPYEYVVDDYGSALCGTQTIDLYKPSFYLMNKWGARNVPVQIIQWGSFQKSAEILEGRKHVPHADHVRQMLRDIEKKGYHGYLREGSRA